ncbi:hypothetical protein CF392_02840 [Tamilnaduibacter salinus]|uniref:Peptidase M60 domain-containing protein n=1 Tax=Tamilnaduibacter salinus TaxID=1484056 RepID=A0A2A2I7J5_9GAMM|nr:ImpA family metalloprotease [Tamilnaduibacter salinus]PAV27085.1 hypothetical protein CF392_02840 [Tamilnaduibacter salinus]
MGKSVVPALWISTLAAACLLLSGCGGGEDGSTETTDNAGNRPAADTPSPNEVPTSPKEAGPIEQAVHSGNALAVPLSQRGDLLQATLDEIDAAKSRYRSARVALFNLADDGTARADGASLTGIDWYPSHDAALLEATFGVNASVLTANAVYESGYTPKERGLAVAGQGPDAEAGRYLVMGGNPMRNDDRGVTVSESMHQFMDNALGWLTREKDLGQQPFDVVITHLDDSYYFPDESATRAWLTQRYGNQVRFNPANACDNAQLGDCLANRPDLVIVSQHANEQTDPELIASQLQVARKNGIPLLYMHLNGDLKPLGKAILSRLQVRHIGDNYWHRLGLRDFDARDVLDQLPGDIAAIQRMLRHFQARDYAFDLSLCEGDCSNLAGYQAEFQRGAETVRRMMRHFDRQQLNLFDRSGFRFQKLLALYADHLRQTIQYPMDRINTDTTAFLESLFADHAVYNTRTVNPAQSDMGNFSRSDFSHVTPTSETVTRTSKRSFRAAGVYALPGETVSVTRKDDAPVATTIFVNTQRPGATHLFEEDGYNRPKYLRTPEFPLAPGDTITFTSPYGGPIQIGFDRNGETVELAFERVGKHPFWDGPDDDQSFREALIAGDYDWAEIATAGFEVHSTLEKMRESINSPDWNSASDLANATERYVSNLPHVLAGFQGSGIDKAAEVHDFAQAKGWAVQNIDIVKHMNADQATCGYGCSGNPYDAYWAFDPVSHGDLHELGHGLEKDRFLFPGWDHHASTNYYSYFAKSRYFQDTGRDPACQGLPFREHFDQLQTSQTEPDPQSAMQQASLTGWSDGAAIYLQMMMLAQHEQALDNGWLLLARLHLLDRAFARATNNDSNWADKRHSLGFDQYSRDEASAISRENWLLIALSVVTERDMRDYLQMWGFKFSPKALNQVASLGLQAMPRTYIASGSEAYCKGFDNKQAVPVDGASPWPL